MFSPYQQCFVSYSDVLHVLIRMGEWRNARVMDPTMKLLHRVFYSVRLIAGGSPSLFTRFNSPISVTPKLNSPFFLVQCPPFTEPLEICVSVGILDQSRLLDTLPPTQ